MCKTLDYLIQCLVSNGIAVLIWLVSFEIYWRYFYCEKRPTKREREEMSSYKVFRFSDGDYIKNILPETRNPGCFGFEVTNDIAKALMFANVQHELVKYLDGKFVDAEVRVKK